MHPFYGPNDRLLSTARTRGSGLVSMAAYLAFWALALVMARRELDARFPRRPDPRPDRATQILRERYAAGELSEEQLRAMERVLNNDQGGRQP